MFLSCIVMLLIFALRGVNNQCDRNDRRTVAGALAKYVQH